MLSGARGAATALIGWLLCSAGCYEPTPLRVSVQTPGPIADCAQVADGVFRDASFQRVTYVAGPDLFYTPRFTTGAVAQPPTLGWGVGVWIKGRDGASPAGPCEFELENLQAGPMCSAVHCLYTPQRGADFDETLKSFAQRLAVAAR
jgi:hypothetical protein